MKLWKTGLLVLLCLCCLFGCQPKARGGEEVRLTLSKTAIELAEGESEELTLSVQPSDALDKNVDIEDIVDLPVREQIGRAKYIPEEESYKFDDLTAEIKKEIFSLSDEGGM